MRNASAISEAPALSAGRWRIPRSRGALGGFLLMLCGIWGALIPFVGPYFNFAYTPNTTWDWTAARFWLEVLPGLGAFVGGALLLVSGNRATAVLGGWIAAVAGVWFVTGPTLSMVWHGAPGYVGFPVGGEVRRSMEQLSFFYGIGALTLLLGALSLGRLSVHSVRDVRAAERREAKLAAEAAAAERYEPVTTAPAEPAPTAAAAPAGSTGRDDTAVYPSESGTGGLVTDRARAEEEARAVDAAMHSSTADRG